MVALVFVRDVGHEPAPKRVRKAHNKVRSGCLTCKIRRKKCGEEKPSCKRCTSTGRTCDGYESTQSRPYTLKTESSPDSAIDLSFDRTEESADLSTSHPVVTHTHAPTLCRPPKSDWFTTDDDFYCFDYFRNRTGPAVSAYFDSKIWRTWMVRACFLHPAALQAAAAVGASHRRFELGISSEAFQFCAIADRQYCKALKHLARDLQSDHFLGSEVVMMVSLLLATFEIFQGNEDSAIAHYEAGMKHFLQKSMKKVHTESCHTSINFGYQAMHDYTDRLEKLAVELFDSPTTIYAHPSTDKDPGPMPRHFTSLEQARDAIITEGGFVWENWRRLERGDFNGFSAQLLHVSRLLEWSRAYAEYQKSEPGQRRPASRAPYVLKLYREALYLVILVQLAFHEPNGQPIVPPCSTPELCRSHPVCLRYAETTRTLGTHFARVTFRTDSLFGNQIRTIYNSHSISMDSGIGAPLQLAVGRGKSTKVRYQATSLLADQELVKKACNNLGVYNMVEKLGGVEEKPLMGALAPWVSGAKWAEVTFFLEEKKMMLMHCRDEKGGGGGLVWTTELYTY